MKKFAFIFSMVMVASLAFSQGNVMFNHNYPYQWQYDCNSMEIIDSSYYLSGNIARISETCEYGIYGFHVSVINTVGLRDTTVIFDSCNQITYIGWQGSMAANEDTVIITGDLFVDGIWKVYLLKIDRNLDTISNNYFMEDTLTKRVFSLHIDNENNTILCGGTDSSYNEVSNPSPSETYSKAALTKVSPTGEVVWAHSYAFSGCSNGCWQCFRKSISTYDKGYIAIGTSHDSNVHKNIIVKVDSLGNQKWVRFYGNPNYDNPNLLDIVETNDSCIVVCGAYPYDEIGGGLYPYDGWLIKLDKDGNEKWNRKYRDHVLTGMSDWRDTIYSFYMGIYERENGDLITISATHSDENGVYIADKFRLRCLDSGGNIRWDRVIDSVGGQTGILQAQSVKPTADGGIAVAGSAEIFYMDGTQWTSDQRIFLIKTDSLGNDVETTVTPIAAQPISKFELVCYPNPASGEFWVEVPEEGNVDVLEIYATNGSLVYEQQATPGVNRVDLCGVRPGMYLVKMRNANVFGKVVVE